MSNQNRATKITVGSHAERLSEGAGFCVSTPAVVSFTLFLRPKALLVGLAVHTQSSESRDIKGIRCFLAGGQTRRGLPDSLKSPRPRPDSLPPPSPASLRIAGARALGRTFAPN